MRRFALAPTLALVAAVAAWLARASWADYPSSILWERGSDTGQFTSLPGAPTGEGGIQGWNFGQTGNEGCYDIVYGGLEARGSVNRFPPGCGAGAWMTDDYRIDGPPSAQLMAFETILLADMTISGVYGSSGAIWTGPQSPEFFTSASGPQAVVVGLSKSVGEDLQLEAHLTRSGRGTEDRTVEETITLRFRGLLVRVAPFSPAGPTRGPRPLGARSGARARHTTFDLV